MTDDVQKSIEAPSDFRKWIMEPDYEAFMRAPTDLRLAFHAAASLFHLRDWVAHARKIDPGQMQEQLEARCRHFGLVRDVANSSKHLQLRHSSTSLTNASGIRLSEVGPSGYGVGPGGYGTHMSAYGPVLAIVVMPEGELFVSAAVAVHQMWSELFEAQAW